MPASTSAVREEIRRLRRELGRLPSAARHGPAGRRALDAQRAVDGFRAIADGVGRDRARTARDVAWLESEAAGFEKALLLVAAFDDAGGSARLQRRLSQRRSRLESTREDLERLDARLAILEADIAVAESDLAEALAAWLREAQSNWVAAGRPAPSTVSQATTPPAGGPPAITTRKARSTARMVPAMATDAVPPPETWSPVAVLGYRVWAVTTNGLCGAWRAWPSSRMTADCSVPGEVPHTDGRCARVAFGCGIYAATSASSLMREAGAPDGLPYAVGLVGLEGKVVQHERGYRAERATVLALAVVNAERTQVDLVDDPASVETFFVSGGEEPALRPTLAAGRTASERLAGIDRYLMERARRYETWTSAGKPA